MRRSRSRTSSKRLESKYKLLPFINEKIGYPPLLGKSKLDVFTKVIWIGLVKELYPELTYPGIAEYIGLNSHSGVHGWHRQWLCLAWTDRFYWLMFITNHPDADPEEHIKEGMSRITHVKKIPHDLASPVGRIRIT